MDAFFITESKYVYSSWNIYFWQDFAEYIFSMNVELHWHEWLGTMKGLKILKSNKSIFHHLGDWSYDSEIV